MGRKLKAGKKGESAQYITRAAALRKLQVSLADFRRLCILKGVYPREPKKKLKGKDKTYYHKKDILFIQHEPLLDKFREIKIFKRKYRRALARKEFSSAKVLMKHKPVYTLHHLVKERFPTLVDAIREVDDALANLAMFSVLPADDSLSVSADIIKLATKLLDEFLLYLSETRSVRKAFISIKGFYVQSEVMGENVLLHIPHAYGQHIPNDVDFRVLLTFADFHTTLIKFLNFKLYSLEGYKYPPAVNKIIKEEGGGYLALSISKIDANENENDDINDNNNNNNDNNNNTNTSTNEEEETNQMGEEKEQKTEEKSKETEKQEKKEKKNDENEDPEKEKEENKDDLADFKEDDTVKKLMEHSEELKRKQHLFDGLVFFVSREVPLVPVSLIIKSCGGEVLWGLSSGEVDEKHPSITHHIIDRPEQHINKALHAPREYIQPQWVFDSLNSGVRLPVHPYRPSATLPPHLSPFVNDAEAGYVPKQREVLDKIIKEMHNRNSSNPSHEAESEDEEESDDDKEDVFEEQSAIPTYGEKFATEKQEEEETQNVPRKMTKKEKQEMEERERGKMMLSKKHKRLLDRIEFGKERKTKAAEKLMDKRRKIEAATNKRNI